jgi:hypothetical protein
MCRVTTSVKEVNEGTKMITMAEKDVSRERKVEGIDPRYTQSTLSNTLLATAIVGAGQ